MRDEFYRAQNQAKRSILDAERQVEEDAKRRRREQVKEMMEEAERIKSAGPVKLEMKMGFGMGAKGKAGVSAKPSGIVEDTL